MNHPDCKRCKRCKKGQPCNAFCVLFRIQRPFIDKKLSQKRTKIKSGDLQLPKRVLKLKEIK